jgi:hypothetical protein
MYMITLWSSSVREHGQHKVSEAMLTGMVPNGITKILNIYVFFFFTGDGLMADPLYLCCPRMGLGLGREWQAAQLITQSICQPR